MEIFETIVNCFQLLSIVVMLSILDVCRGPGYTTESLLILLNLAKCLIKYLYQKRTCNCSQKCQDLQLLFELLHHNKNGTLFHKTGNSTYPQRSHKLRHKEAISSVPPRSSDYCIQLAVKVVLSHHQYYRKTKKTHLILSLSIQI